MTEISNAVVSKLRILFKKQVRELEFKSVYWFRSFHYSEDSINFVINWIDDLNVIYDLTDTKLSNDCDTLDIYFGVVSDDELELVLVYSPLEFFDSDRIVGIHLINTSIDILIEKFYLKQIW